METHGKFIIWPEIKSIGLKGIYLTIENIINRETDAEFERHSRIIVRQAFNYISPVPPDIQNYLNVQRIILLLVFAISTFYSFDLQSFI